MNFRAWVEEMANFVKHLDSNHLVSIGEEGFFGEERPEAVHNPAGWAGQIGQDFVPDHMPAAIDFATMHTWPDNWDRCVPFQMPTRLGPWLTCMRPGTMHQTCIAQVAII